MSKRPTRPNPQLAAACLAEGNKLFSQNQTDAAIAKYRQAIKHDRQYFQAHFNLGIALRKKGKLDAARAAYQKALDIEPENSRAHYSLGNVLLDLKQTAAACESYQRAIDLDATFDSAYFMLGFANQKAGKLETAMSCYEKAIAANPRRADAYYNLGLAYSSQKQPDLAIAHLEQAVQLLPDDLQVKLSLGKEYKQIGNFTAAQQQYAQVVASDPQNVEAHFQLGYIHHQNDDLDTAIAQYQQVIELNPQHELAYSNMGTILRRQGQLDAAIAMYEQALQINPKNTSVLYNLGNALLTQKQFSEAIERYRQVVALKPDAIYAHQDLANLLFKSDIVAARAAAEDYHRGCAHLDSIATLSNLVSTNIKSDYYDVALKYFLEIETYVYANLDQLNQEQLTTLYRGLLFFVPFLRDDAIANTRFFSTIAATYVEKVVKPFMASEMQRLAELGINAPSYARDQSDRSPLRIGFLSENFKRHSVGWCSAAFINQLRDFTPEMFFYTTTSLKEDDLTQKFRQVAKGFHKFGGERAEDRIVPMLQQMWQDRLDVLIELDSTMSPLPAYILYASPAKVCMSWPGFEAPFISAEHYFICDRYTQPEDRDQYYLEKLFRVPDSHMAVAGFSSLEIDREQERQKLGIASDQIVYLYAAPAQKSNPDSIAAQAQILAQIDNSVILRKGAKDLETAKALYAKYCEPLGVDSDRVIFLPHTRTEEEHRIIYQISDVCLDSYPYNGGTHNLEALWFDLPVVTFTGNQSFARMGYSFLSAVEMKTGVAHNWEEYITWAVRLGQDLEFRNSIRAHLATSKSADAPAPLWDPAKFAYDLYNSLARLSHKPTLDNLEFSLDGAIADTPTPISNTSESLFFKKLADEATTTIDQLAQDPVNSFLLDKLRHLRQQVTNQWLTLPAAQLPAAYNSNLGKAHARLLRSELRLRSLKFEGTKMLQNLYDRIAADTSSKINRPNNVPGQITEIPDAMRCLIALTLFKYPHQLSISNDRLFNLLITAPRWLFGGLLQFCLEAPIMFMEVGEGEHYCQYLSSLVEFLHNQISQHLDPGVDNFGNLSEQAQNRQGQGNPQDANLLFWQGVARHFTLSSYFVPAYFNQQNLRQAYQHRAAIVMASLQPNGYQLDWQFAPRPSDRPKIRLGILKHSYAPYTETYSTLPIFEHLDRDRFEIFLYAAALSHHPFEQYCQEISDRFIQLPAEPMKQAALIRQDDLDLMFIGTNITAAVDPITVLALHRLARVQLTNFCSPVTTGNPNMDYYLSGQLCESIAELATSSIVAGASESEANKSVNDRATVSPVQNINIGESPHYQEKLITLNGTGYCFSYYAIATPPASIEVDRQSWGAKPDTLIFTSGANFYKILPELRHTWAKILAAVPNSMLMLYPFGGNWRSNYPIHTFVSSLIKVLAWYGVKAERLVTMRNIPSRADVKKCLQLADIYLDSFPYAGANSTIEPLEVGLPTVVMDGNCLRNKQGAALLRQLGIEELIVNNEAEYIDLAVQLATDDSLRQNFSRRIKQAMQPKPPFLDSKQYAQQLEPLFEYLISQWQPALDNHQTNQKNSQTNPHNQTLKQSQQKKK
jgi:protein O-GlcNAc transferase